MKRGDSAQLTVGCLTVGCKRGVMAGGAFSLVSFLPDVAEDAGVLTGSGEGVAVGQWLGCEGGCTLHSWPSGGSTVSLC